MSTEPLPTPQELALLSVAMFQAGMAKDGTESISKAMDHWRACDDELEFQSVSAHWDEEGRKSRAAHDKFLAAHPDGKVPVEAMVRACNAHRIMPSPDELRAIGERREWERLSQRERTEAVYLVLTSYSNFRSVRPIEVRRELLARGFDASKSFEELHRIRSGKKARQSAKGKLGAESKRRKPRAPRGDGPGFEKKARHSTGKFKGQKK